MKLVKVIEKLKIRDELDKLIESANIVNEENLSALSDILLMDTKKEDVFLFNNKESETIFISIDKNDRRKEKYINMSKSDQLKLMKLEQFKPEELRFLVSNM